jgi:hypothetical protein
MDTFRPSSDREKSKGTTNGAHIALLVSILAQKKATITRAAFCMAR